MRNAFATALQSLGEDPRVMLMIADTGHYVFRHFAEKFPAQFLNMGISEQNLIGIAAGLALEGNIPLTYSIAAFYSRCFDQIRVDACYNNTNIKMVAVGSGLSYGTMGPTHHSIEDIAMLRALPNLTILSPCDPPEARALTNLTSMIDGPVYLRLALAGEPVITEPDGPFYATMYQRYRVSRVRFLQHGSHATIVGTGRVLNQALLAARQLAQEGIRCDVIDAFMLKPFDVDSVRESARRTGIVLTVEEHNVLGGLGTIVAEALVGESIKMTRLGLRDTFCPVYGGMDYVFNYVGISANHIALGVRDMLQ